MRRFAIIIFVMTLLVAACLGCACVTQPGPTQPSPNPQQPQPEARTRINAGISAVEGTATSSHISVHDAYQQIYNIALEPSAEEINKNNLTLCYIRGRGVDAQANATEWLFAVRSNSGGFMLFYDRDEWKMTPWDGVLPQQEISFNQVITPAELFKRNVALLLNSEISQISHQRIIELREGVYTVSTYAGNKTEVLTFDATTGALILSND